MERRRDDANIWRCRSATAVGFMATVMLALAMPEVSATGRGGAGRGVGGGRLAQSSIAGSGRSMVRPGGAAVNAGNVSRGSFNRGTVNTGNLNRGNVNTGNVNRGNVNTGNVNIGNDVNIDIDGGHGYHGDHYYAHPIAAGVTIGAVAVTTAAVLGSYYSTLPPGCTVVVKGGVSYHHCGSVYYQETWSGNDVVYVVVNP